jgi:hypothetical protein
MSQMNSMLAAGSMSVVCAVTQDHPHDAWGASQQQAVTL